MDFARISFGLNCIIGLIESEVMGDSSWQVVEEFSIKKGRLHS